MSDDRSGLVQDGASGGIRTRDLQLTRHPSGAKPTALSQFPTKIMEFLKMFGKVSEAFCVMLIDRVLRRTTSDTRDSSAIA